MKTITQPPATRAAIDLEWRTPLGPMRGTITEHGLRALRFPAPGERTLTPDSNSAPAAADVQLTGPANLYDLPEPAREIAGQVTRALVTFFTSPPEGASAPLPPVDWCGAGAFDQAVWHETATIPCGQTITYGELAARIGRPGAARAVGGALGRNPLVLLVPCHRVVSTATGQHRLCGFTGGLDMKAWLLRHEGHEFAEPI